MEFRIVHQKNQEKIYEDKKRERNGKYMQIWSTTVLRISTSASYGIDVFMAPCDVTARGVWTRLQSAAVRSSVDCVPENNPRTKFNILAVLSSHMRFNVEF